MANIKLYGKEKTLSEVCEEILPIPNFSVLIGMAEDHLPILLDVSNPKSPNLIVWDSVMGQGIGIIRTAIGFVSRYRKQNKTEFVVISDRIEDFSELNENGLGTFSNNECVAVVPFWSEISEKVIFGLSEWCSSGRVSRNGIILFVDGIENLEGMSNEVRREFIEVVLRGRRHGIFTIVTAKMEDKERLSAWIGMFQKEIFGMENMSWFDVRDGKSVIMFFVPKID